MTDQEINRTITEAMGKCVHDVEEFEHEGWGFKESWTRCRKCREKNVSEFVPKYTESWSAFGGRGSGRRNRNGG